MHEQGFRPLCEKEIVEVLTCGSYCMLGMAEQNIPYVVPMFYDWRHQNNQLVFTLYSREIGKKMTCMKNNANVCLEIQVPSKHSLNTVIVTGIVTNIGQPRSAGRDSLVRITILALSVTGREYFSPFDNND